MSRPVTLRDIAHDLGVSVSTVSRALGGGAAVHPATRSSILATAERLGYVANPAARSLSTGRTGALGLIVPDLRNPFFSEVAKGAGHRGRATGHAVFIVDTDHDPALELEALEAMRGEVDGVLLCAPVSPEGTLREQLSGIPAVLLYREILGFTSVVMDYGQGVRQAIEHLKALGHTRIAHVAGPIDTWDAQQRRAAFEACCDGPVLGPVLDQYEGGVAIADVVLSCGATAAVACSDVVALGMSARLRHRKLSIPDDFSIVGVDGLEIAAMAPALSSVSVPRAAAAQRAVSALLDRIEHADEQVSPAISLPTQFILRESTGPATV